MSVAEGWPDLSLQRLATSLCLVKDEFVLSRRPARPSELGRVISQHGLVELAAVSRRVGIQFEIAILARDVVDELAYTTGCTALANFLPLEHSIWRRHSPDP